MNQNRQKDEKGKLFIGRLSWETQSDTLLNYFSRYGEVIDCVVMKNKETGCSRGFGFVTYKDPECVHLILSGGPHIIDGRQVDPKACNPRTPYKVSETKPQSTSSDENQIRKIFVGGLPFDVDEGILIDFFSRYGKVKEASIMYDLQKGRSRGFGFLTFDSEDSVDEVCKEHFVTINGKQVECKRAEPLSRGKMTPNDNNGGGGGGGGGVNNNYFMQSPPPPMPYHMQHPPPAMDHKPTGLPGPGMEMWRPPHESGNGDNRKEMNPENGDGMRQPYPTNGPPTSMYQPVSYPGIYSVAQQQQIHQQQQQQQQQLPQPATPMQQPTAAGQAYSLPPMYPNFSSPPLSAQQQPPPQDYMAPWNQAAPVDTSGQAVPSDGSKWSGVPPPPPHLLAAQTQPTQQSQHHHHQQQLQQSQQQQQPAQQNSSYNIQNQISSPSALPTVYPGLSPLGQMKIPPNFVNAPQTQVQQTASSSMPYSNYGFAENENANFAAGAPAAAGNGHIMMFADASGQPPGQNYNQRQPIAQTFHPYRR